MVVNYDLPLLNERGGEAGTPDIETYIHRIGELSSDVNCSG